MADLVLCFRDACALATTCRRSRLVTEPGWRQEWQLFGPPVAGWCESYLKSDGEVSDVARAAQAVERAYEGAR